MTPTSITALRPQIVSLIEALYPGQESPRIAEAILSCAQKWHTEARHFSPLDEKTVYFITYGDAISAATGTPLQALHTFARRFLAPTVSDIHLLPMFPYSSDDGFSVIDYYGVDPALGSWSDIQALSGDFSLMFDCVINHISQHSEWFTEYLKGNPDYQHFFIEADKNANYQNVVRPRTSPLFSAFTRRDGKCVQIWTTFSDDQIDLNFNEPDVLLESINILLYYAAHGATSIRLDAIGFIWKASGTTCIHLPQAHQIIRLWRLLLDAIFPGCRIITETNVPHQENIAYFGQGDEAQMVYQFPLPPLTLHAFLRGNARWLRQWSTSLDNELLPPGATFFNFLASHDGIGLRPTENLLDNAERDFLVSETLRKKGRVSWKNNSDGSTSPYELNINYLSALSEPGDSNAIKVAKTTAAHAILMALKGVPAIYYHSLLGSENDLAGVEQSGINRRINREKLTLEALESDLLAPHHLRCMIFSALKQLLVIRKAHPAFSPAATQTTLALADAFFGVRRHDVVSGETITCVVNVTGEAQPLALDINGECLFTGEKIQGAITLQPWQVCWINHTA
ncbi:alpha-amylase family glycosyl hydrolase [Pseudocitrobacter sp. 73]|uniref:alpha-amylase family glycosyl hydrolase n=1 Tax=Pseudocitrobacter sp. 73 TaxID=2605731 RepID=UPI0011ECA073|nr:alpha-amylase family glycosyl hydrolase [Pseudocitrobacter sp. 73]KAA1049593.1 DUF3459 domain-containing protein [Pseudocitrobacter sp. 73]